MNQYFRPYKKTTYFIDGKKFFNTSKNIRDGFQKARNYCLENFLDIKDIIIFDSELECDRYIYLLPLQEKGLISNLKYHYEILIQNEFINANGDKIPAITYNADFIYKDVVNDKRIVEDVKGISLFEDTRFEIAKALFDKVFLEKNLYVAIIIYRNHQWVEWKLGEKKKSSTSNKKAREANKANKKLIHDKTMLENKKQRQIASYRKLKALPTLTYAQNKRLKELEEILKEKDIIIS